MNIPSLCLDVVMLIQHSSSRKPIGLGFDADGEFLVIGGFDFKRGQERTRDKIIIGDS